MIAARLNTTATAQQRGGLALLKLDLNAHGGSP
jgi:hypothetical protein